jgi:hypothetical protein
MVRQGAFVGGLGAALLVFATWAALELPTRGGSKDLVANRAWVERMPKSKKDLVTWFVPMDLGGKRFGVAQRMSHYAFAGERFVYTRDGDRLTLTFQQTERKSTITAKAYECAGKAPKPFDLCLDLKAGNDKATFYSKRSWKRPGEGADGEVPAFDLRPLEHDGGPALEWRGLQLLLEPGVR